MTPDNSPYQQRQENRSRSGFVLLMVIFTAVICLMALFALFYEVHQKAKPEFIIEHSELKEDSL